MRSRGTARPVRRAPDRTSGGRRRSERGGRWSRAKRPDGDGWEYRQDCTNFVSEGDAIFAYYKRDRQWNHAGAVTGSSRETISITQHCIKNHTTLNQWLKPKTITAVSITRPGRRS